MNVRGSVEGASMAGTPEDGLKPCQFLLPLTLWYECPAEGGDFFNAAKHTRLAQESERWREAPGEGRASWSRSSSCFTPVR